MAKWTRTVSAGLLILAAMASRPAHAQKAGTYTGTTADGKEISFTIGTDPFTGQTAVIDFSETYMDTCPAAIDSTIGGLINQNYGPGADIPAGPDTVFTASSMAIWVSATLHFEGNRVSGQVSNEVPILITTNPYPDKPKRALLCTGKRQHFSAVLSQP